jgi:methylated-DNA-protein-cysteine methyltransferase-like protein
MPTTNTRAAIYRVVKRIPRGKVATYGQVAALAEIQSGARQVGYALAALSETLPPKQTVPWQRVVNRKGEISYSFARGGGDDLQRAMLEAEGVVFDAAGRIDLAQFLWVPRASLRTNLRVN